MDRCTQRSSRIREALAQCSHSTLDLPTFHNNISHSIFTIRRLTLSRYLQHKTCKVAQVHIPRRTVEDLACLMVKAILAKMGMVLALPTPVSHLKVVFRPLLECLVTIQVDVICGQEVYHV